LTVVHKKINIAATEVPWEHEQFARRRILAVTLSHLHNASSRYRSSFLDNKWGGEGRD
jgi:hypothetical protein